MKKINTYLCKMSYYNTKYDEFDENSIIEASIIEASTHGNIQFLEQFKNSSYGFKYDITNAIKLTSYAGNIQVLEWFKNSGYEFKYSEWAIINASRNGKIKVLEWFKNSGYEFKYNHYAIDLASENGHIQVLEWFKNSGYEFKYTKASIHNFPKYNLDFEVLDWFKNSGIKFKYVNFEISYASICKNIKILDWFKNYCNIKKIIILSNNYHYNKAIKYKTKNNYLKGYNKN